jgi:flagellar basal body-associated protein FliL
MKYLHMLARHGFQYGAQKEPKVNVPMGYRPSRQDLGILILLLVLTIVLTVAIVGTILLTFSGDQHEPGKVEPVRMA